MEDRSGDDHPFIIKMPDMPPTSEYGLGYTIFHAMKKHSKSITQHIVATEESQTFEDLLDDCIRVSINLRTENLSDDDIIGLSVWNHKHSCVPYIAGLFVGKIVTALDPTLPPIEVASMLRKVTPKILFVDQKCLHNIEEALKIAEKDIKLVVIGGNSNGHITYDEFLVASEEDIKEFQPVKLSSNTGTAVIFFTSGTSGEPKGICISHAALQSRTDGDYGFPVFTIFAQLNWISYSVMLIRGLRRGSARVIVEKFNIDNIWKIIAKYRINGLLAPSYYVAEFTKSARPEDLDTSLFKVIIICGSSAEPEVLLKLREVLPDIYILQGYGLTELGGGVTIFDIGKAKHREWMHKKLNSCGAPVEGIWYKVVDPDTEEILGPNKPGELRIKSKLAMTGYYNSEVSEIHDSEGWLKTGDLVQYDEDQCFFIVGRLKDVMFYRSFLFVPTPLEHILMTHPAVDQAAVFGIPHGEDGDFAVGIVTLKEGCNADPKELEKYVQERVMDAQRLRGGVKIIKEIPMTSSGKIQRRILKEMVINGDL